MFYYVSYKTVTAEKQRLLFTQPLKKGQQAAAASVPAVFTAFHGVGGQAER